MSKIELIELRGTVTMDQDTPGHNYAPCPVKGESLDIKDRLLHGRSGGQFNLRGPWQFSHRVERTLSVIFGLFLWAFLAVFTYQVIEAIGVSSTK